jgi:hypothetical protein
MRMQPEELACPTVHGLIRSVNAVKCVADIERSGTERIVGPAFDARRQKVSARRFAAVHFRGRPPIGPVFLVGNAQSPVPVTTRGENPSLVAKWKAEPGRPKPLFDKTD